MKHTVISERFDSGATAHSLDPEAMAEVRDWVEAQLDAREAGFIKAGKRLINGVWRKATKGGVK